MKTIKDYFKEFENKVVSNPGLIEQIIEQIIAGEPVQDFDSIRRRIFKHFNLVKSFIKAQPLENQRDLWNETVFLLNASKAFNDENNEIKEEIREDLLVDCFKELENVNNTILQLQTQKTTTVEGNAEKSEESKKKGKGKVKPSVKPFNWQGKQAQLVYLIEQLYEQGFLSPISQPEKHRLTAQHFTVEGKSLNQKNLARTRQSSLNNKSGKPKGFEKIDQIISAAKKQNP
jgi:hypothetical protein